MIDNYRGTKYYGSDALETSVSGQEIIPNGMEILNFNLLNDMACTISINGSDYIYIRADQGIIIDKIRSCKIYEDGITYNWIGVMA